MKRIIKQINDEVLYTVESSNEREDDLNMNCNFLISSVMEDYWDSVATSSAPMMYDSQMYKVCDAAVD